MRSPPPILTPPPTFLPAFSASSSTANEDFDLFLSTIQTKVTEFGDGGSGQKSDILSPNILSPRSGFPVERLPNPSPPSLSPAELFDRLRRARKSVRVVDMGLNEDVKRLADSLAAVVVLDPAARLAAKKATVTKTASAKVAAVSTKTASTVTTVPSAVVKNVASTSSSGAAAAAVVALPETMDEPVANARVALPFKKRLYPSVPSPKTKEPAETPKASGKEGKCFLCVWAVRFFMSFLRSEGIQIFYWVKRGGGRIKSINQSINQSLEHSVNQSSTHSIVKPKQSINQSIEGHLTVYYLLFMLPLALKLYHLVLSF